MRVYGSAVPIRHVTMRVGADNVIVESAGMNPRMVGSSKDWIWR
jgi:hypothetical protein